MKPERDAEVLSYLRSEGSPLHALDIARAFGVGARIYPVLARLETAGSVRSDWEDLNVSPRRRIYWAM